MKTATSFFSKETVAAIVAVFSIALSVGAAAQSTWSHTFGGTQEDAIEAVVRLSGGGFAGAGYTNSYGSGGKDGLVVKLDTAGAAQWRLARGRAADDDFSSLVATSDGGCLAAGYTTWDSGDVDFWAVKLDSAGTLQWERACGGQGNDYLKGACQTNDGGFVLVGVANSTQNGSAWAVKLDSNGNEVWQRKFGNSSDEAFYAVQATVDGGVVIAGNRTDETNLIDAWIVRLDSSGAILWQRDYGVYGHDFSRDIIVTSDGAYLIGGSFYNYANSSYDGWLLKVNSSGIIWQRALGGTLEEAPESLVETSQGNYIAFGRMQLPASVGYDFWAFMVSSSGALQWEKLYAGSTDDTGYSVCDAGGGGYVGAGRTLSFGNGNLDGWFVKFKGEGQMDASCNFVLPGSSVPFDTDAVATDPAEPSAATQWPVSPYTSNPDFNAGNAGDTKLCYGAPEPQCIQVGDLALCADQVTQDGDIYYLEGNVNIAHVVSFSGIAMFKFTGASRGLLKANGNASVGGNTLFQAEQVDWDLDGAQQALTPLGSVTYSPGIMADLLLFDPGQQRPVRNLNDGVIIKPSFYFGGPGENLAQIGTQTRVGLQGGVSLESLSLEAPGSVPMVAIQGIWGSYNQQTDTISGTVQLDLPMTYGLPPAVFTITGGCVPGIHLAMTPGTVPLGAGGISIEGFGMDVVNLCQTANMSITVQGEDVLMNAVPRDIYDVAQAMGVGMNYQFPGTLNALGGLEKILGITVGSPSGRSPESLSGWIKLDPPASHFRGETNVGDVFTGVVSATFDIDDLFASGNLEASVSIPDFDCPGFSEGGAGCLALKSLAVAILGGLPKEIAHGQADVTVWYSQGAGEWYGVFRALISVGFWSCSVQFQYSDGVFQTFVGSNFQDMFQVFGSQERVLSETVVERTVTLPTPEPYVAFSVVGNGALPSIYLKTPQGQTITPSTAGGFPGVTYRSDSIRFTASFEVLNASAGDWTLGEDNLPESDVAFLAHAPQPQPETTFTEVLQSGDEVAIASTVAPALGTTKVHFFYSASAEGGEGNVIALDLPATTGTVSATWNTASIPNGTWYLFAKTDDGMNLPQVTYYGQGILVDYSGYQAPSGLTGSISGGVASLTWTPSSTPAVVGYNVLYTDSPQAPGYKFTETVSSTSEATIEGLDPLKNYRFAVVGFDAEGNMTPESLPWSAPTCTLSCSAIVPSSASVGSPVSFSATGTGENCSSSSPAFAWAFGDGATSDAQEPSHAYSAPGNYQWTLTVSLDGRTCAKDGWITLSASQVKPGDCDASGGVSIGEVQKAINMFLGTQAISCGVDCNGDGVVSIGEVQKVINAFLGTASTC